MRNVTDGAEQTANHAMNADEVARFVERFALLLVDSGDAPDARAGVRRAAGHRGRQAHRG